MPIIGKASDFIRSNAYQNLIKKVVDEADLKVIKNPNARLSVRDIGFLTQEHLYVNQDGSLFTGKIMNGNKVIRYKDGLPVADGIMKFDKVVKCRRYPLGEDYYCHNRGLMGKNHKFTDNISTSQEEALIDFIS